MERGVTPDGLPSSATSSGRRPALALAASSSAEAAAVKLKGAVAGATLESTREVVPGDPDGDDTASAVRLNGAAPAIPAISRQAAAMSALVRHARCFPVRFLMAPSPGLPAPPILHRPPPGIVEYRLESRCYPCTLIPCDPRPRGPIRCRCRARRPIPRPHASDP